MPDRSNNRCSTGELPMRVLRSQRTRLKNLTGKVMMENAHGNLQSHHDYRCAEIAGVDLKRMFDRNGISRRISLAQAAQEQIIKRAQEAANAQIEGENGEQIKD